MSRDNKFWDGPKLQRHAYAVTRLLPSNVFPVQKSNETRGPGGLWVFQIELTGSVILNSDCTALSIASSSGDEMHLSGTV